jgi:hypothetical protein
MTFHTSGAAMDRSRSSASLVATLLAFLAVGVATSGCKADGYELGVGGGDGDGGAGDGDGGGGGDGDGGGGDGDGGSGNIDAGTPDACPIGPDDDCDGTDDDCDGETDEDADVMNDEANCGECGNGCVAPHTVPTCNLGICEFTCIDGFYDYDDIPGCEYQCYPDDAVDLCDFRDNDCDGEEDEDTNINTDEDNCGGCGQLCRPANATPLCQGGVCGFVDCDEGFSNVDGDDDPDDIPGCEYQCPENPALDQEECDGEDDDCDGVVDELPITGLGDPCSDYGPLGGIGACTLGQMSCDNGTPRCLGDQGPTSEICDSFTDNDGDGQNDDVEQTDDDDCDGDIDETFNFNTDEQNCGRCGRICDFPNAVPICQGGNCQIFACLSGYVDANGIRSDGCEYQCTPSGPEVCDGRDNDCDTLTDTADPDLDTPANFCRTAGQCANAAPTCSADLCGGPVQWRCLYNDPTRDEETDSCGNLVIQEADCDNRDNDCDGRVDESHVLKNQPCSDGDLGECVDTGNYVCQADAGDVNTNTGLRCDAVDGGSEGGPEECDDLDNDCDGDVDEDAPDEVVAIDDGAGGLPTFYIYAYEASKPDASASGAGSATHRSCSNPGVFPWRLVSRIEAQAACSAAGRRLCSEDEWQLACETTAGFSFPYGDNYEALTCNGKDYDADPGTGGNQDAVVPTGEADQCIADWGAAGDVFDMSGNLKEWTGTEVATDAYRVRGGAYNNVEQGLSCDFDFLAFDEEVEFPSIGFRCCSDTP